MVEKFFNSRTVRSATDIFSGTQSFSIRFGWFRPLVSHKRKKNFVPAPCQHQFLQVNRNFELTLQQPHNDNNFFYFWKAVNSKSWFSKKLHQKILTFPHCGKCRIFLSFKFYVKSILENLEVVKLRFLPFLGQWILFKWWISVCKKCKYT